jgi:hypothetical protein
VGKPEGKKKHFEALGGDGRIILKWIFKKSVRGRVLIHLAKDRLRAVANAVMNPRVPYNAVKFSTTRRSVSFLRLCVIMLVE